MLTARALTMLPLLLARVGAGGLEPPALAFLPAVGATCCMGSYSALGAAAAPSLVAVAPAPAARGRPPRIISAIIVAILSRRAVAVPRMPFDPTPRRNRHNGRENDAERSICLMRSRSGAAPPSGARAGRSRQLQRAMEAKWPERGTGCLSRRLRTQRQWSPDVLREGRRAVVRCCGKRRVTHSKRSSVAAPAIGCSAEKKMPSSAVESENFRSRRLYRRTCFGGPDPAANQSGAAKGGAGAIRARFDAPSS
jgi:hypothetical protein